MTEREEIGRGKREIYIKVFLTTGTRVLLTYNQDNALNNNNKYDTNLVIEKVHFFTF